MKGLISWVFSNSSWKLSYPSCYDILRWMKKKISGSHPHQILCSRFCLTGEKLSNANNFKGFHNWYQFLLEQQRNPTQTRNIAFNTRGNRPAFVGNRLVSYYFIQSGNIYQKNLWSHTFLQTLDLISIGTLFVFVNAILIDWFIHSFIHTGV